MTAMCSVSAISGYYTNPNWPGQLTPQWPSQPSPQFQQILQSDPEVKEMLRKVVGLLDKIDKRLGDIECMDEQKAEFFRALDMEAPKADPA